MAIVGPMPSSRWRAWIGTPGPAWAPLADSRGAVSAASPVWHEIAAACQEVSAVPVAQPAVARPSAAEPAVAGPSAAEPPVAGPSAAKPAAAGPSAAEPAAARPSAAKLAVAKPLAAEPVVPGPSAAESAAAGLSSAGPQSCGDLGIVPAGLPPDLEQALRWSTGLPKTTPAVVRRLAAILTDEQATDLVKAHRSSLEAAPRPACNKRTGHGLGSRAHASRLLHIRLADAKAFADWAAANGTDHRKPEASLKMRQYLKEASAVAKVPEAQMRSGRQYLVRCLKLFMDETFVRPTTVAARNSGTRGGGVAFRARRRILRGQGRPEKASMVKQLLFKWFCTVRRSVRGRIPPSLMLAKARMIMESYVEEHAARGMRADAAKVDYTWLSRWRFQFRVSLRQPNRKWSVPRHIMKERLEIVWCNIFRVRRLMARSLGYEPIIENFDQSPFHMNEVGSKATGSLSITGGGSVALVEGHAATRERWSANTMVASRSAVAGRLPPLQLMFKASSGVRLLPKLQAAVPGWAPWLSVEVSQSGSYCEADILNYMDSSIEGKLMEELTVDNEGLAIKIKDLMFVFDNLREINDRDVQTMMREVSTDLLTLALKGVDDEFQQKFLKNMSSRAAEMLVEDMEAKGPVKLSDVEAAQKEILSIARRLEESGEITLSGTGEEMV